MEFSKYTVVKLKNLLRKLNLKTTGTKDELLMRLENVDADALQRACSEIEGNQEPITSDNGGNGSGEGSDNGLYELVERLSTEVRALREAAAAPVPMSSTDCVSSVRSAGTSAFPDQWNMYSTQPLTNMSGQYYPQGCGHAVYTAQNMLMSTGRPFISMDGLPGQPSHARVSQPTMATILQPTWEIPVQQPRSQYKRSATQHHTLSEVAAILPSFDPVDETYTSTQFVERIEQLNEVYGWSDAVLTLAVLSKLKGVAKRWADVQPVFRTWESFVTVFLNNFPCIRNPANAHIALMKARINKGEKMIEYYYRMLALGRRENIEDIAIIKYIINGLYDENMKRTLSMMQFQHCSELLKSIQNLTDMYHNRKEEQQQRVEVTKEPKYRNEKYSIPDKKVIDLNKDKKNYAVICFKCRQRGHIAKSCTQNHQTRNNNEYVNSLVSSEEVKVNEKDVDINAVNLKETNKLMKNITICGTGTINCKALIDSGSGRSLIKRSIAERCKTDIINCYDKLVGFAGGEIICTQKTLVKIKIDDVVKQAEFLIINDDIMVHDMLVGLDILEKATIIIENGSCKMMINKHTEIDIEKKLDKQIIKMFDELTSRYKGCFGEELHELGKSKRFKMNISVTSSTPVCKKPYNIPIPKRKVVEDMVRKLLKLDIIRPSTSLYASPIVLVHKQNGEDRMCIDYRQLNAITEKQPWSMPTVDGVLSSLNGHAYFTTLDLMSGYYQIEVEEKSKHFTAFVTHNGHYEFNRMPFGLRNAPCSFQRMMCELIKPLGNKVISYVDEIIIATKTAKENLEILEEFLSIIRNEGLTLRISKCSFLKTSVSFLGHIVDVTGIKPGSDKIKDVVEFPIPNNQYEVRRFLGLTGFFRKFVANYAQIAKPLTNLTKKDVQFVWSHECNEAFRSLINELAKSPVLAIYDITKQHQLHTDASCIRIAAILMQENGDGKWHAVAYFSRCCNSAERNYHAYELEVLAVVEACERFRMYLLGKSFTIVTDCQSISTAKLTKPMVPRVARWMLKLQEYDYQLKYRSGESMRHVDALSRAPGADEPNEKNETIITVIETHDWVSTMQQKDEKLKNIMNILTRSVQSDQKKQIMTQYVIKNHRLYYKMPSSSITLVVPKGMRWRIVKLYHDDIGHPAVETVIKRISTNFWFPRMRNYVKSYIKSCVECAYYREGGRKGCELYGMEIPSLPFQILHLDHLGPFVKSKRGFQYILNWMMTMTVKNRQKKLINGTRDEILSGWPSCHMNMLIHVMLRITKRYNGNPDSKGQLLMTGGKRTKKK